MNAAVIRIRLKELLGEQGRSLYWLAKKTGIPYQTLWRIKDAKTDSIDFRILGSICTALNCQAGDVLVNVPDPADLAPTLRPAKVIDEPENFLQRRRTSSREKKRAAG
jgi:putative transcriptional regulator